MGEKHVLTSAPLPPDLQNKLLTRPRLAEQDDVGCTTALQERERSASLHFSRGTGEGTRNPFYSLDCVPLWGVRRNRLRYHPSARLFPYSHDSGPHSPKMCTSECQRALAVLSAVSMNVSCGCVSSSRRALASLSERSNQKDYYAFALLSGSLRCSTAKTLLGLGSLRCSTATNLLGLKLRLSLVPTDWSLGLKLFDCHDSSGMPQLFWISSP